MVYTITKIILQSTRNHQHQYQHVDGVCQIQSTVQVNVYLVSFIKSIHTVYLSNHAPVC